MKDELKDNRIYFGHVLDAIARIERFTSEGRDDFLQSELIQDAVIKNIGVIGEAIRQVSAHVKQEYPHVPWQQIVSMRNRVVHGYFDIDLEQVWDVVESEIPALKAHVQEMLRDIS